MLRALLSRHEEMLDYICRGSAFMTVGEVQARLEPWRKAHPAAQTDGQVQSTLGS